MYISEPDVVQDRAEITCRLCHRETEPNSLNIFESSAEYCKDVSIAEISQGLWSVQYERHEFLSELICPECLDILEDAFEQRRGMQEREKTLQEQLKVLIKDDAKYRPGLNGNPGEFEPEEGCDIVDVDPEKLAESSEDEFALGSDGEYENYDDDDEEEEEEFDEDDEEDAQNGEDVDMPLGMDAAQMAAQKSIASDTSSSTARPKRAFLCQYCDLGFTLPSDCQEHERSAHDPNAPYCCTFCNLAMVTRPALISHIKILHDPDRPYVCAQCRKGFVRRSDLKKHTIVHTGVRPYTCNVCSKSFSRNTNLTKHLRIHSGVKPFVCQQCPRSFQTAVEMMRHSRSHGDAKAFQCTRCPCSFTRKDKLVAHQQVHTRRGVDQQQQQQMGLLPPLEGELSVQQQHAVQVKQKTPAQSKNSRNYRCDVCDRAFQRERDLQRHRALHMDSLFACKICNQGFNRREQLHRHELEAHGPSFTCAICCISFLHQIELENHLKVHQLQHKMAQRAQEASVLPLKITEQAPVAMMPPIVKEPPPMRPSASELSFYSNMIPTMNLGFYSETRPEE
ncbi:LOW QUALITY PROTEIN: zinc finger protein 436 [Drosophila eugracilis]|uniref:LOW QUALITY PROTEIN: zinc finger protein 436 n=1 Tax=Drosophila eugracilis TaxID=29029 RepID=UPI0007E8271C|nr:LOW QUALITY PROTEIN: zinc finger protein 436 [Drosophila eugracilis]